MPAGFTVYNDFGTIQVDENYSNMCVVASGVVATDRDELVDEPIYLAQLPVVLKTGEKLAIRSVGIYSTVAGGYIFTSAAGNVYWYVFGPPPASPAGTGGLQVFNSAGQLTFDSSRKYARVRAQMSGTRSTPGSATYEPGRDYAVLHARRGQRAQLQFYPDGYGGMYRARYILSSAARQNGAAIEFSGSVVTAFMRTLVRGEWNHGDYSAHIIDVTGY